MTRGPFDANQPLGPEDLGPTKGDAPDDAAGIPDDLIDSILDGGMPRHKMRDALDALRLDQNNLDSDFWTADALDALRADVQAPDMSEIILARTGMHRSWLSSMMRRKLVIGRIAGVAAVLTLIAGAFMVQRAAPEAFHAAPTPVGELANAFPNDAAHAASVIRTPVAYTVPQAPAAAESIYMLDVRDDRRTPEAWREGLLAMDSFRDLWPTRRSLAQPMPAHPRVTPIGLTSETITLIAPILPEEDRESSAAIIAGQR